MLRKLVGVVLVVLALVTLASAVPGLVDSVAFACDNPSCG